MSSYRYLRYWVEDLPKVGCFSFSLEDARAQFPDMADANLRNTLHRLSVAGKIRSVWRGYYAIVLSEYGLDGNIPPVEYIDQLMAYIETDYYVALLSAASYQGASHQPPQRFQVISNRQMRSKKVSSSLLEFAYKKNMPGSCIVQKPVKSGYLKVSAPALTALDLISYPSRSGGISHVTSVLSELVGAIDIDVLDADLLKLEPCATVQRLGYLFERVLGEDELANALFDKSAEAGLRFRIVKLIAGQQEQKPGFDEKWKIVVNYAVEADE